MCDRADADRDVLFLLDRAAAHTPPLHLDRGSVVERGEQIVRRRRATVGGMSLGALTLVGAAWLGLGGGGSLLGTAEVIPASVTWEVEEPTTLTVLDGVERGGNVSPVTVSKSPEGGTTATFTVDGHEETVAGTTMAGGADVFVGERATVMVWRQPAGASPSVDVLPAPLADSGSGPAQGDEGVHHLTTTGRGWEPQEIVFHTDTQVWTASGEVAQTAEVSDGRWSVQAFELPGAGLAGDLEAGQVHEMDIWTSGMSGYTEPWWRGGDDVNTQVYRVPVEAAWVRPVWVDGDPSDDEVGEALATVRVGDSAFAVHTVTEEERSSEDTEIWGRYQWSTDGTRWEEPLLETEPEPLPTSFGDVEFAVGEDGTATAIRDDVELVPLPGRQSGAWSWADDEGSVVLMDQTVDDLTLLLGGGPVPSYDLGSGIHVAVDEEHGVWVARYQPDGRDVEVYDVVVGEVDGEGVVLLTDGARNRVAVVSVMSGEVVDRDVDEEDPGVPQGVGGADALAVIEPGAVVLQDTAQSTGGVSATEGAWPGVSIRSTVVQCLKSQPTCVRGLDTAGDGRVDVPVRQDVEFAWVPGEVTDGTGVYGPGETLTVLGREQEVRDSDSGWPVLAGAELAESGPHELSGRFPWADGGTAYALVGLAVPDELDLVAQGDGEWLEPAEVHVVQGRRGSVTVLVYPPGTAQTWGAAGVRGPDGEVAQLPLP